MPFCRFCHVLAHTTYENMVYEEKYHILSTAFDHYVPCDFLVFCRYKISLLKPSVKALALSTRVSIRTDNRGFLSLQYMIKNEDGQVCFVEYYVSF